MKNINDKYIEEALSLFFHDIDKLTAKDPDKKFYLCDVDIKLAARKRVQDLLSSYTTTLLSELATKKRWVKTFRDENTGEPKDEYVVRDKDIQEFIKLIKNND